MRVNLPVPLSGAVLGASVHGMTDVRNTPLKGLWPYALVPIMPETGSEIVFACASIVHFSEDIGLRLSTLLVVASFVFPRLTTPIMTLYYLGIHVPRTMTNVIASLLGAALYRRPWIPIPVWTRWMIVAHTIVGRRTHRVRDHTMCPSMLTMDPMNLSESS
jgi:hypothetical protein